MTTIHDEAAEKVELAKTYAEDGAFASAARIYREIANMYQRRAEETLPNPFRETGLSGSTHGKG